METHNNISVFLILKQKIKKTSLLTIILIAGFINQSNAQQETSLKELIENSLLHSQQVKIKEAEAEKHNISKKQAYKSYLPKVSVEGTYTYLNDNITLPEDMVNLLDATQALLIKERAGIPFNQPLTQEIIAVLAQQGVALQEIPPIQDQNIAKANISAKMLIFSGMQIPYSIKAANQMEKFNELLSLQERAYIIKEVLTAYDKLAVVAQSEEVLEHSEKILLEQERFVEMARKNGLATDLDSQKIELARQKLKAKTIELSSAKKMLVAKLAQLSGMEEAKIREIKPALQQFPLQDSIFDVNERPDLQAIDNAVKANELKQKIQYTNYIPKVFAFGKKEMLTENLSAFDPEWYIGVGVSWNIFDGMKAHHDAQKAKMDQYIFEYKKDETVELLNLKMQSIKYSIEKNNQLSYVAEKELAIAEKAFELSQKEFKNGLITLNSHLESINDLEKAKLNKIEAIYQQRTSVVDLYETSGKLYETALSLLNISFSK